MTHVPILKILCPGIFSCFLIACDQQTEQADQQPLIRLVKTQSIGESGQINWREFPGVVDAAKKADLGFRIAGKLEKLFVKEGDIVKQNQLLAQLESTDQRIQLQSRQAEYDQTHSDFIRGQKLIEKNLISRSDFNKLKAQDETAKAALDTAKQNIEYTALRAPFVGRIAQRHVDNFEEVNAKQAIYTLQDQSEMTIKIDVPESLMIRINKDAQRKVYASFDTITDREFPLAFREVATQADENTNTFEVTFNLPKIDGYNILPGMSVTVKGAPAPNRASSSFHLPAHAVLEDGGGRYVYVVENINANKGIVQRRNVDIGTLSNLGMEIIGGLQPGDEVITAGMSKMHPDLEVRLSRGMEN